MTTLGTFMVSRGGSLTPNSFPDEEFELYSIPAHDRGGPEIARGSEIGSSKQIVQPGDVMISKIIPHIRRARVVAPFTGRRQLASGEWIVFRGSTFDPDYLRHFLLSDGFHHQFMNTVAGVGGSLVRARPAQVKTIGLPLPPLPEQRRIAAILDHADALRAKRRQVLTHLDALTQSIFCDMFGDPDDSPDTVDFGALANLSGGRNLVADDSAANSPFRVLKISAVTTGQFKPEESKPLPPDYAPPAEHLVRAGDLLMSRANTTELVGAVAYVSSTPPNLALPDKVWRFSWKVDAEPVFYHALLSTPSIRRRISRLSSGTGGSMKNVSKSKLEIMPLPRVSVDDQRVFVNRIQFVTEQRSRLQRAATADDTLFASLQSRAFRGDL